MLPQQQRVVDEKIDLDAKIEKLMTFLEESVFDELDHGEQSRLRIQLEVMKAYGTVLGERIAHFG